YNCLIDVLGRAGRLDEAENIINNMKIKPGEITLMTLLGACRTHLDVERAERIFDKIKKLESAQNIASAYVLMANIYKLTGKISESNKIRELMEKEGIKKIPGVSEIEIDGEIHRFYAHDNNHKEIKLIREELEKLSLELQKAGYIHDTRYKIGRASCRERVQYKGGE